MRRFLTLACCILCLTNYAQTKKGTKLVGAGIGLASFSHEKIDGRTNVYIQEGEKRTLNISINPSMLWFMADNFALGGLINAGLVTENNEPSDSYLTTFSDKHLSVSLGPVARYYFGGSNKGKPFTEALFQINIFDKSTLNYSSETNGIYNEITEKIKNSWTSGIAVGYEHFLNNTIGVFATIGFTYSKYNFVLHQTSLNNPSYSGNRKQSVISLPINVGAAIHFNNSK